MVAKEDEGQVIDLIPRVIYIDIEDIVPSSSADSVIKHFAWLFSCCPREQIQFCVTIVEISTLSWEERSDLKIT